VVRHYLAHGALAMTTPGDTSMATLDEVERLVRGAAPRVARRFVSPTRLRSDRLRWTL